MRWTALFAFGMFASLHPSNAVSRFSSALRHATATATATATRSLAHKAYVPSTPRDATPRHSTPRHSTPLHSTPRHSTPLHAIRLRSTERPDTRFSLAQPHLWATVRSHRIVSLTLGCDSQHNYEKNLIKPSWSADGSKVGCGSSDRAVCCAPNRSPAPTQSTEPCGTAARTVAPTVSALMLRMARWPCVCCSVVSRGFTHPHGSHPQSSSSANVSPCGSCGC